MEAKETALGNVGRLTKGAVNIRKHGGRDLRGSIWGEKDLKLRIKDDPRQVDTHT